MVCGGFACSRNALCALNVVYVESLLSSAWGMLDNETRSTWEKSLNCCGFFNRTTPKDKGGVEHCSAACRESTSPCITCGVKMMEHADEALKILGGVGLFFSFTEVLGVWLAMRYRNQKDPRANPSAFL
ncbi:tetraspanin-31 isoform X2 [Paroedura picta]|uniref:tetraspanin-31 isoform X2 n=1 Tax=Paroedura picta TaxID=143630 RepID=UPI0040577B35